MLRYVWRELVRNPRRTMAALVGLTLGVGLFSGVLFFVDGSSATLTQRSLAPLALDMQRVLTSPLGSGLRLEEKLAAAGPLRAGQQATVTLRVVNTSAQPVADVVVNDEPPQPLTYVPGTATMDGRALPDTGGHSPLAQGLARSGLNIGTVPPRTTMELTYAARADRAVKDLGSLRPQGTISSREDLAPLPANAAAQLSVDQLRARIARIPGVAAADGLSFVDLPPGSVRVGGSTLRGPVRVFGFDRAYQQRYPSIQVTSGSLQPGSALLSAEAARAIGAQRGATAEVRLPGGNGPLKLPVSGITDLSSAKPLFYSRTSTKLEDFIYVPNSVVVSPAAFERTIIPAFREASAKAGGVIKSPPVQEVDVLVDRARLQSDPATALAQTKAIARAINRIAPGQDYLIDNISNTLEVASHDAVTGRRMFLFLGLPGALLAAFFAAFAGGILAATQRRERANLRLRGAHRGHLRRMLAYRTLALAGAGSILGTALGLLSVMAILGSGLLFDAATGDLVTSALIGIGGGMATSAIALYVPGRRSLGHEVSQERGELASAPQPAWRRLRLDLFLLAAAAIAETIAIRSGTFDASSTSVSAGQSVSLPTHLLLAPVVAWIGGVLLSVRVAEGAVSRLRVPAPPRFGGVVRGTLVRSLKRRSSALSAGVLGVGLVVAFGVSLATFAATYDAAKARDSTFVVGGDLRITPSVLGSPQPPGFAGRLQVPGVSAATPVVGAPENSVLSSRVNQAATELTAIDPASFGRVAPLSDSYFSGVSADAAMAALQSDPRGLLVDSTTADDLRVKPGDTVNVLLARGTKNETPATFHVVGLFERFPGFPQGTNLVANLGRYESATGSSQADFFLARSADGSQAGLARAVSALRLGPGSADPINVESRSAALDKEQSSLTALNLHGLVDLDSLYIVLMSAAGIAILVFGLLLQRRREYVTLLAQGMRAGELRALVLGEAAVAAFCGLASGVVVGTGFGVLLVRVLRPLFILDPGVAIPVGRIALLAGLAAAGTLASSLTATAILRRLEPSELLRES
jgi:putative ABC transport system permease protein